MGIGPLIIKVKVEAKIINKGTFWEGFVLSRQRIVFSPKEI